VPLLKIFCFMDAQVLQPQLQQLAQYFSSGATQSYAFRIQQLQALKNALLKWEGAIYDALHKDLGKSREESWVTEIGFTIGEINFSIKHLKRWMQPQKVGTNLMNLPSRSYVYKEPLGVVLIIGAWNYPLQLLLSPLVGAIAAGNVAVLKPSEQAPATAAVLEQIIRETFAPEYIKLVQGDGAQVVPALMNHFRFNHVFYTGSTAVGKLIYKMAAEKLVPVTLELGGKSPCVVEGDADIKVAARRIALTKFSNAGQMCVAPDYVLVHHSKKEALVKALGEAIQQFFTHEPSGSASYGRIINEKQFNRLLAYLQQGKVVWGGRYDAATRFIEPTLLTDVDIETAVMGDEIFGPLLPILTFETAEEAKRIIARNPSPLAFYIFTQSSQKEAQWIADIPFGGGCVNNASWHLTNPRLPFGGRDSSGIGSYHGAHSFDVFSHKKAVMKTPTWFDPAIKYPPFAGKLALFKKLIK
jgi:aldehyde dehydrogenase (NAD+)